MFRVSMLALVATTALACGPRAPGASSTSRPTLAPEMPVDQPAQPAPGAQAAPTSAPAPRGLVLPDHVRPTAYALELEVDADQRPYAGRVIIDLELREPISSLWLNAVELEIDRARLLVGDRALPGRVLEAPAGSELLGLDFGERVDAGAARLEIAFRGEKRQRVGLFRQEYEGRWYAYTDFEPTDARRAFPCFDEPRFKVPWTIELVVPRAHRAFANTPAVGERPLDDDRKRVSFATTRPLPSYLVAFAAGPFDVVDGPREPIPMRVIVPKERAALAAYALVAMPALLDIAIEYFDAPVPYRKLDLISVPRMNGAMENPGLITVGSQILLLDPDDAAVEQHRLLALVIAHELAHLWLGDSVTLAWWDDLWLNEGFATWMADKLLARWQPEWRWELEAVAAKHEAMLADSEPSARALRQPIEELDDIRDAFDAITYKKGGAVLAMFEAWLGEETFRAGVRAFVRDHADGSASADDLLAALSAAAERDVATPFRSFLDQPGLAVVDARLRCDGDRPRVELAQRRYRAVGDPPPAGAAAWQIPVCVRHPGGVDCALLANERGEVALSTKRCPRWFHPNASEAGYYRYALASTSVREIAQRAQHALAPVEATGLVASVRAGLRAGDLDVGEALPALRVFASSELPEVVHEVIGAIADLRVTVFGSPRDARYAAYVRRLFGKRARALGLAPRDDEPDERQLVRPALLAFVGDDGNDRATRDRARRLARAYLRDRAAIHPSMREAVFVLAALDGDAALFDAIVDALDSERLPDQRELFVFALASFAEPALTRRALDLAFGGELEGREGLALLRDVLANPRTRDAGFAYFRARYDEIIAEVPDPLQRYVPFFAAGFCTAARAEEVERFFGERLGNVEGAAASVSEVVDQILRCDAFRTRHQAGAEAFFR